MKRRLAAFSSPSFALISVLALVSLAALTATAFLASARIERQATRSLGETARLEMACASARACAGQTINVMCQKSWQVLPTYWRGTNATDWTNELGYLLLGYPDAANVQWAYTCGFNPAIHKKLDNTVFKIEGVNTNPGSYLSEIGSFMATMTNGFVTNPTSTNTNCTLIPLLGGRTSPPVGWTYIYQDKKIANSTNTTNVPVARFSYYMEDLSGLIDAERMGGTNRTNGINASEITLTNLTTNWSLNSIINASNYTQFINPANRAKYFSPGMMLYAGGLSTNDLRYFAHGLLSWNEFPDVIPLGIPISKTKGYNQGNSLKMNLNSLGTSASGNVDKIAQMITSNLSTNFLARAGGLTNNNRFDYAKCIAANIVDYIDSDSTPSIQTGPNGYRGCEALPLVSEVAIGIQWTNQTQGGRYNEEFEVTPVIELWNMYNKTYAGTLSFAYNCTLEIGKGPGPSAGLGSALPLCLTQKPTTGNITNSFSVSLAPNEYRVFIMPSRGYSVLSGSGPNSKPSYNVNSYCTNPTNAFATNMASIMCGRRGKMNATNFSSFWELAVGGVVYDRTTSIQEGSRELYCEPYVTGAARNNGNHLPDWASHVPSLRLDPGPTGSLYGTGDPRMTWFITNSTTVNGPGIMNANDLDVSGSFGYRNRIWAYSAGYGDERKGSTNRPDLWLDGGHLGSTNGPGPKPGGDYKITDTRWTTLTNRQAYTNQPCAFIADGPMRNITELGNIYDPIQWQTAVPSSKSNPQPLSPTNITTISLPDYQQGGGNTLRIGRAEHPRFAFTNLGGAYPVPNMGQSAAALLDLFSLSNSYDNGGRINLNTAPAPVLRALAGGVTLTNDPSMKPFTNLAVPTQMAEAFAQGVMRYRATYPFLSPSQLAFIATDYGATNGANHWTNTWPKNAVFGNTNSTISLTNAPGNPSSWTTASNGVTEWNDQAAEEWFSKIYNLSTVQSWNYRTYVVAQLVGTNGLPDGPFMRKYYLMYIRYTGTFPSIAAGPFISFESPY